MRLFIAEKPKLGRLIAKCLGKGGQASSEKSNTIRIGDDVVTWCFGHMLEPAEPEDYDASLEQWSFTALPIVPTDWRLVERKEAATQIRVIEKLVAEASLIVNAGDPDREGQLLVDELLDHLGARKPVKRIWIKAQNEIGVIEALGAIEDNEKYRNLRLSAEARQRCDWLIGINLTRAYTLAGRECGYDGVLSVGRVQTPTLALVVARDMAIERFRPKDFHCALAEVTASGSTFTAKWRPGDLVALDDDGRLLDQAVVDDLARRVTGQTGPVVSYEAVERKINPPLPWSLAALQSAANKRFGLSAQKVLDTVQSLYEAGLVSYPRTDCRHLPESQHALAPAILAGLPVSYSELVEKANPALKSAAWNDAKVTAHDAIIPVKGGAGGDALTGDAAHVFDMIVKAYLCQFFPPATYRQTTITIELAGETFVAKGKVPMAQGWKIVEQQEDDEDGAEDPVQELPSLSKGETVTCGTVLVETKQTTPPARFTEGTLIDAMMSAHRLVEDPALKAKLKETVGLGTEATRAGILETLKERDFLTLKGKSLVSTMAGRKLISALPEAIKSVGLTALFEQALEGVVDGAVSPADILVRQVTFVTAQVEQAKSAQLNLVSFPCPVCRTGHLRRSKSDKGVFWGCSRWKEGCKAVYQDQSGKPVLARKTR